MVNCQKWCPTGCGKKINYIREGKGYYQCQKCDKQFNKKQLKAINGLSRLRIRKE